MRLITTVLLASFLLVITSCNDSNAGKSKSNVASPDEKQEIFKQFTDVTKVEVWRKVDGMNSSPIIIEDAQEIKDFYNLIGNKIEMKPACKFTAGITYTKKGGDQILAEINLSDDCQTINYFNAEGKMEYHNIRPEGLKLLKSTIDKIALPN